jgi:hypothetical protein
MKHMVIAVSAQAKSRDVLLALRQEIPLPDVGMAAQISIPALWAKG